MLGKIIDLTAEMFDGAPTMPMDPKLAITKHCNLENLGYNLERVTTSTHQGTHIDAPYHFFYEGQTIDKVDISRFVLRTAKVDLTHKKPKEAITVEDIKEYEPLINKGVSLLLHTGWDKVFPKNEFFYDFPFVSVELTNWLVEKKIPLIGMDMPTPNGAEWKLVHQTFLKNNILVVEGLTHMEQLGNEEFTFFALPLKLKGCGGSPIRAIAILDE